MRRRMCSRSPLPRHTRLAAAPRRAFEHEEPEPVDESAQSDSMSLLLLRQKLHDVHAQLDRKKAEFDQRMRVCQEREQRLAAKQRFLKERVHKFDRFVRDNDAKRLRAVRKEKDEVRQQEEKQGEVQSSSAELARSSAEHDETHRTLAHSKRYETFLRRACDESEDFHEIADLEQRHAALAASASALPGRLMRATVGADKARAELGALLRSAQTEALVLASEVACLQEQLDQAAALADEREAAAGRREGGAKQRSRELGMVFMAIENIHARSVRSRSPQRKGARASPEGTEDIDEVLPLLSAIGARLTDLQAAARALRGRRRAVRTSTAEGAHAADAARSSALPADKRTSSPGVASRASSRAQRSMLSQCSDGPAGRMSRLSFEEAYSPAGSFVSPSPSMRSMGGVSPSPSMRSVGGVSPSPSARNVGGLRPPAPRRSDSLQLPAEPGGAGLHPPPPRMPESRTEPGPALLARKVSF